MRKMNNRAIQAKVWSEPMVASYMTDLRHAEEQIRSEIMVKMSQLIHSFHRHCIDTTLARANITKDERIHAGSSLCSSSSNGNGNNNGNSTSQGDDKKDMDVVCLDAKERMYLILKEYQWIKDFFRLYPMHFFENSFQFVNNIPQKTLDVKVKVVGLGVGGSLAVSGLKKRGIDYVIGYDKRSRHGERSVTSRYQNASWRAYDIASGLLDDEAYNELVAYQQRINVMNDDGTSRVLTSDRVQIILGSAIDSALASAERYGADLRFESELSSFYSSSKGEDKEEGGDSSSEREKVDIVALFTGAHTSEIFEGLGDQMKIFQWPNLSSNCKMWLQIKPSEKRHAYTARDIEVGAENWHFAIESARKTIVDVKRIRDSLSSQYNLKKKRVNSVDEEKVVDKEYKSKLEKIDNLIQEIDTAQKNDNEARFDYIFANAPDNEHNRSKIDTAKHDGNLVIDGNYKVDIKIASKSAIYAHDDDSCEETKRLCEQFSSDMVVMGGDACVPPNPMAAYGATLACEFAEMMVQLAVSYGHLNAIEKELTDLEGGERTWGSQVKELKALFTKYYDARGRAENYFQWMQTLICNLYSLPPAQ